MSLRPPPIRAEADIVADLVRAALAGDRGAFAELHRRAHATVRGVLMAKSGMRDLDDLVQDVFVLALGHLAQLGNPAAFIPWVVQIARRHAGRSGMRPRVVPLQEEPSRCDSPRVEAERVLQKICALPECYAEPLTLRLVFGMSGPEIAEHLGLSPGYVRVNLHRGMRRLRRSLGLCSDGGSTP